MHPSWSPTSGEVVFHRPDDGIWSVGSLGSPPPHRIIDEGINPTFSWDGLQIVYERFPRVWLANANGTNPRPVDGADLLMPTAVQNVVPGFPALSPDGASIVYFRSASGPLGDLWIVPAGGGEPRRLTFDTVQASHPTWSAGGHHVIFSSLRSGSRTLWRVAADGGEPEAVTAGVGEDSEPALSRDGQRLVYTNVRNEFALMVYGPETGESREILTRRYGLVIPRFAPDGESVVFFSEVEGGTDIFVVDADGRNARPVTRGDGQFNIHPRWSADGSSIYFYRDRPYRKASPGSFLKVSPDGGAPEIVVEDFYWDRNMFADVHPDDNVVAFTRTGAPDDRATVFLDLASGHESMFDTPSQWDTDRAFHIYGVRWSHDGEWLVGNDLGRQWRAAAGGANWIWVCAVDGDCRPVVEGFFPAWSGDDSQIYFQREGSSPDSRTIWVIDRDGPNARLVTEIGPQQVRIDPTFDVAPDGRIVWRQHRRGRPEIWSAETQ